jgi:hypothetical protein
MPEELYNTPAPRLSTASGWMAGQAAGQQDQSTQGMNEQTKAYIETLAPEDRQKAIDEFNAPLTGMEVYEALKQSPDFTPTHEEYTKFLAYDKEHKSSILAGLAEGAGAVMGDLGRAAGAVVDHPLKSLATAPANLIEAFAQGTRNLYGMVSQSASPNSVLFKMRNALAGDGTVDGYNQFLEARKFNKHSADIASGKETLIMDKDVIDHDITLAMSYIADPTLFIPFGAAATAGMKAVGLGSKLAAVGGRASAIKAALIGGGLKWGVGAPIEAIANVTRGTIEKAASLGGTVLETTTGISAAELRATARLSAAGTTTASALGGHIPIVSDISNVYVASGAARGFGEAIGAVGEQIQKRGFKRGYDSFAREALEQTKGLSPHAQGLLKVLDAIDPMMSYGYGTAVGMGHGALIGGTLGYLNAGEEGLGHGLGAGIALGGVGSIAGRVFADATGGTKMARAEVQGTFNIESMRADKHQNLPAAELLLELGTRNGDRAGALQVIGGLGRIAPDLRLLLGNVESQKKLLQSKGLNADGHRVDKVTGKVEIGKDGKPIPYEAPLSAFYGGEGFTMHTEKLGDGKQEVTVVINTDALASGSKNVMHHELFHAVFKTTIMEKMFRQGFSEAILGKFDANGIKVKDSEINPKEFRAFVMRELRFKRDAQGNQLGAVEVNRRLKEFDAHLAEYQKAGSTTRMNPDSAKALDYLVEEFGAHYATQFMKGKPVDYLFRGAEYTGMQGVMDRLHNNFLDFWQGQTARQNPTFGDFKSKSFDESFGPNKGKRTLEQRSAALDYMVQDLLRSVAGKRKGSTNSFDVRSLSPEARNAYFDSAGMDGVRAYYDKDGNLRNVTEAQVRTERLEVGKAIHESLSKLDPKETVGLVDADGNFGSSSTLGTKFNDTVLAHLVKEGHISQQLAERIKTVQDIVSGKGSNRVSYLYKGASMETEVGPNSPRVYGKDVPITSRETIVVGYSIKIKKDGGLSLVMKGLDANVIDARGNIQWAKPEVRALWQGDRNAFDQSFFEYLSNASKASTDRTRVESSLLPLLARGDGFGAERRNIMHQFLGMAKRKDAGYFNVPIAEIPRGKTSVVTNFTMDTMSPMQSNSPLRYDFNLDNAHSDLSRNFKVSDMEYEKTPQADIYTHASGFKIIADKNGASKLYDNRGQSLGSFKDKDLASGAMEKAYLYERAETNVRIERVKEDQQKQQQNFKVWDGKTMEEARRLGDIFETEEGKTFVQGTSLIRQTREEFYSDNFTKLRQADPDTVMAVTEQIAQRGYQLRELRTQAYDKVQAELAKGKGRAYKLARDQYDVIVSHADRYNDILLAYERATRAKTNGQGILDYINTHRRTSTGYDNMAKVFFGDHYDSQFQTGKAVTTVATHGTSSHELLTSREFDPAQSGSKHGAEHDKVGIFLSGETKTSHGYADPKEGGFGYRQVRAAIKFNNPLVVDAEFRCYSPEIYEGYMRKVRDGGHDGVIIKNVYDGGSADTVFIINNESVKDNTAIIDTHIGMERVTRQSEQMGSVSADSDQGSVRYPIQESTPRGKGVRVGSELGLSWKVDDSPKMSPQEALKEAAFERVIPTAKIDEAKIAGRYEEGVDITRLADKNVAVLAYDSAGVLHLADKGTGQKMADSNAWGGAMHSVRSEALRYGNTAIASTMQGVNAIIKVLGSVEAKAKAAGEKTYYATILGANPEKMMSSTVGVRIANSHITKLMANGMLHESDVRGAILKIAGSKSGDKLMFPNLGVTEGMTTAEMIQTISSVFARPLPENNKAISASTKGSAFKQKTAFIESLVRNIKASDSWKANAEGIKKYLGTNESMNNAEGIIKALGLSATDPTNFDKSGNVIKNGHMYMALEFITGKEIEYRKGGHPSYPYDIRYKDGSPVKVLRFETPMLATDAAGSKEGIDIGNRLTVQVAEKTKGHPRFGMQKMDAQGNPVFTDVPSYTYEVPTGSGTGEMRMKSASNMVSRDPNFNTGKTTAELGLKDTLAFKVRDKFYSPLDKAVDDIFKRNVGKDKSINPARLINLIKNASGGNIGKIMTEAQANGLIDFLEAGGQTKMPIKEIKQYLKDNRIEVRVDKKTTDVDADFGETTEYIAKPYINRDLDAQVKGKVEQHTIVLRTNPMYSHGHKGHFGEAVTHIRGTMRKDASNRNVFFVDEMQIQNAAADNLKPEQRVALLKEVETIKEIRDKYKHLYPDVEAEGGGTYSPFTTAEKQRSILYRLAASVKRGTLAERLKEFKEFKAKEARGLKKNGRETTANKIFSDEFVDLMDFIRKHKDSTVIERTETTLKSLHDRFALFRDRNAMLRDIKANGVEGYVDRFLEQNWFFDNEYPAVRDGMGRAEGGSRANRRNIETKEAVVPVPDAVRNLLERVVRDEVISKSEMNKEFNEKIPASQADLATGIRNPDRLTGLGNLAEMISNKTSKANRENNNAPLQDFAEVTRLQSRAIMQKAIELHADRVVFVRSRDTHPSVDMRNARGQQLYDVSIPAIVGGELKKYGVELKPANDISKSKAYESSPVHEEQTMLSESLGYDITNKMIGQDAWHGQPTYKVSDKAPSRAEVKPDLKPFEGNFKVSDVVKSGVAKLDETLARLAKTENLSPALRDAMRSLKDAVRKQDATDEFLVPELRESYDAMVRSIEDQMAGASLTPIESLKEIQKALKPLDKKIQKNTERIQKNIKDSYEADMAEGADVESQTTADRRTAARRDMEEGASLESDQITSEVDRRRGDARLDMEEGANLDSDQVHQQIGEYNADQNEAANVEASEPRNQNLPPQFPYPAPPAPQGLPRPTPSGKPAFPRPPATPALPQVKPSGAVPFPRPPATPALPKGSIAPPPPQGTPPPNPLAPSLTAAKPLPKLSAWRGWTLEKGLNGGFWSNAVGWMIIVQGDKFKVYNPQKAMQGIYEDLDQAKRRVQRAEPKQ